MGKVRRKCLDVVVEHLEDGRTLISGGHIPEGMIWNASDVIETIEGEKYLRIAITNSGIIALCGQRPTCNGFLSRLIDHRKEECQKAAREVVQQHVDIKRSSPAKAKDAEAKFFLENTD